MAMCARLGWWVTVGILALVIGGSCYALYASRHNRLLRHVNRLWIEGKLAEAIRLYERASQADSELSHVSLIHMYAIAASTYRSADPILAAEYAEKARGLIEQQIARRPYTSAVVCDCARVYDETLAETNTAIQLYEKCVVLLNMDITGIESKGRTADGTAVEDAAREDFITELKKTHLAVSNRLEELRSVSQKNQKGQPLSR